MQDKKARLPNKLLFLGQLPPPTHGVSLMNTYVVNSEVIKRRFNIEIINLKFGESILELEKFSIKKVIKAFRYIFIIVKKLFNAKPDLVYFTITPTAFGFYRDAIYVFLLKLFRLRIVLHLHGKGIEKNSDSTFKRMLYKAVFKNTHVICLSEKLTADIRGIYKGTPFIVPNGIAIHATSLTRKDSTKGRVPQILYVSNFVRNKGVLVLVEALAILKRRGYAFNVKFVGAPYDVSIEMLNDFIRENGIEEFATVLGPLYGDDKLNEYQKADIFAFPTYNDVFGLVNLEAMQYGLPIVSTYEGSIPDVVKHNVTGFLVDKQNPQMLAEKIGLLLSDENLRTKMGIKGYERFMSTYTLNHFEKNMLKTFEEVMSLN